MNSKVNYSLYFNAIGIVSGANMAPNQDIDAAIKSLESLIGSGYYDDKDGDVLLEQIVVYLKKKKDS